jgi:glutamine cyclotransferase
VTSHPEGGATTAPDTRPPYRVTWRDRLAYRIANWALVNIATWEYQKYVWVLVTKGREALHDELGIEGDA